MKCGNRNFGVGLARMACSPDPAENLARAEWRIREAAGLFGPAEPVPGPAGKSFTRLAKELGVVVVGSILEGGDASGHKIGLGYTSRYNEGLRIAPAELGADFSRSTQSRPYQHYISSARGALTVGRSSGAKR